MAEMSFPHLLTPLTLRGTTLRNRMIVPGMATHFAEPDGTISAPLREYLEARAIGGFAAVVTENIGVDPGGRVMARMAMANDDRFLPGLSQLAAAIKKHGTAVIGQINHGGRQTSSKITGQQPVAPSPIPCPLMREMPRELTESEIHYLQDAYAAAAMRLHRAGFDGVEIHAAHGYLAAEFLSRYSNARTDQFGGDLPNRMRFLIGIVERIRAATAPGFLIFVRISVQEFVPNGLDVDESILIGRRLAAQGVDVLSLSVGVYESYNRLTLLSGEPEGPWLPVAGQVKRAISIPVIGVGRVKRPQVAEQALKNGDIDLVAIGRASITDSDFPDHVRRGKRDFISSCVSCNLCLGRSAKPVMVCPINPFVGREAMLRDLAPAPPQVITIRGGGIAAMTAAWLAALRGHKVTVVDQSGEFGGMQAWRSRVPGQAEYGNAVAAVIARARAVGVVLRQAREAAADIVWTVRRFESAPRWARKGREGITSFDVLRDPQLRLPHRILIVGDDLSATDAALLLAERGHHVTLRSPSKDIGFDAHPGFRNLNRELLTQRGAKIEVGVQADRLEEGDSFDACVFGRIPDAVLNELEQWSAVSGNAAAAVIDDAYEPGALMRSVYRSVDLVLGAPTYFAADKGSAPVGLSV
jgi:2,4-dienoyl-CoA reductase-like NADH-dependent reductase (Old Yellow Enzyme family)